MLAFSRTMLTMGFLIASASVAEARSGRTNAPLADIPLPVERPLLLDGVAMSSNHTDMPAPTAEASPMRGVDGPLEIAAPTIGDLVMRHARDNGVPVSLAEAVIRIESRGNPLAAHGGALGLMQIKPDTARAVGFSGGASALLIADTNLRFGMKILGQAYRNSRGDVCRALMLYQSGHLATRMSSSNRASCSRARAMMAGA